MKTKPFLQREKLTLLLLLVLLVEFKSAEHGKASCVYVVDESKGHRTDGHFILEFATFLYKEMPMLKKPRGRHFRLSDSFICKSN